VLLQQLDLEQIRADPNLVAGGELNTLHPLAVDVGAGGAAQVRQNVATVLGLINASVLDRNGVVIQAKLRLGPAPDEQTGPGLCPGFLTVVGAGS
jgi:hypothetical protein